MGFGIDTDSLISSFGRLILKTRRFYIFTKSTVYGYELSSTLNEILIDGREEVSTGTKSLSKLIESKDQRF